MTIRLTLALLVCGIFAFAQTPPPTPTSAHDGFVALFYFDPQGHPKANGEFGQYVQIPNAPTGTYMYNSFGLYGTGKGIIVGVPETGVLQHVVDFTPKIHFFANLGVGASFASAANGSGTNLATSFAGGANITQDLGKGFSLVYSARVVNHICVDPKSGQTGQCNTLVGGLGVTWGH